MECTKYPHVLCLQSIAGMLLLGAKALQEVQAQDADEPTSQSQTRFRTAALMVAGIGGTALYGKTNWW
jgi:hypothetical protein